VEPEGAGFIYRFYRGMEHHPRILGVDIKQLTNCRIGMVMWQILIMLFGFYSIQKHNQLDYGLLTNVILQTIYIAKFFYWETGYFNTLDITLDRAGFYLCWGCLFFLPTVYTLHSYYLAIFPSEMSLTSSSVIFVIGLISIVLNYWVDIQKQDFFEKRGNTTIWGKMATFIETKYMQNGGVREGKLLTSGFWGVARKINYTFELLLAFSWCVVGYKRGLIPFVYFIYLSILLIHRVWRDEEKCFKKYGQYWVKYCKTVKYRMIPGFY
jgi:7-dehydrocholesterol reductase